MFLAAARVHLVKPCWLNKHALSLQQRQHPFLPGFGAAQNTGFLLHNVMWIVIQRFRISGDETLEVAQYYFPWCLRHHVVGHDGNFAAAAGRVHDVGGYGVTGRMAAQSFNNFDAARH